MCRAAMPTCVVAEHVVAALGVLAVAAKQVHIAPEADGAVPVARRNFGPPSLFLAGVFHSGGFPRGKGAGKGASRGSGGK